MNVTIHGEKTFGGRIYNLDFNPSLTLKIIRQQQNKQNMYLYKYVLEKSAVQVFLWLQRVNMYSSLKMLN